MICSYLGSHNRVFRVCVYGVSHREGRVCATDWITLAAGVVRTRVACEVYAEPEIYDSCPSLPAQQADLAETPTI